MLDLDDITADHKIPWLDGGSNSLDNLAPSHSGCNSRNNSGGW